MAGTYQPHDRRFRERWFVNPSMNNVVHADIPADVTVLERDPSPCGYCGVRGDVPCKHKPWGIGRTSPSSASAPNTKKPPDR